MTRSKVSRIADVPARIVLGLLSVLLASNALVQNDPTASRYIVGHADCGAGTTFEYLVDGVG